MELFLCVYMVLFYFLLLSTATFLGGDLIFEATLLKIIIIFGVVIAGRMREKINQLEEKYNNMGVIKSISIFGECSEDSDGYN
jgi:hypothetical protein